MRLTRWTGREAVLCALLWLHCVHIGPHHHERQLDCTDQATVSFLLTSLAVSARHAYCTSVAPLDSACHCWHPCTSPCGG